MRLTRLFVAVELTAGSALELPPGPARHLRQVLRAPVGTELVLFNGDGCDYPARLVSTAGQGCRVQLAQPGPPEPPPTREIALALGVAKGERMDYAVQKAVELGVTRLTPLFTERSQVRLEGERLSRREAHWQAVVVAACEQSGRARLPRLAPALSFDAWLEQAPPGGLLLDPRAALALPAWVPPADAAIGLLVGPEGGLSPAEHRAAQARGQTPVRLGPRVLRAETAPLAAIAAIQALWGDFRA